MTPADPHPEGDPSEHDPEEMLRRASGAVEADEKRELARSSRQQEQRLADLEACLRQLRMLVDVARSLNQVGAEEELLERILDHALQISGADRACLLQPEEEGDLKTVASRTRDGSAASFEDLRDVSHTILERVLQKGKTLYVSDALNNPDFMSRRSVQELSLRSVVCVPLNGPSGVIGALYVDSQSVAGLLDSDQVEVLEAFASHAAIALESVSSRNRLERTAEHLEQENRSLKEALGQRSRFEDIVGDSPAMDRVFQVLDRVIDHSVTVLVTGETGTGKELVARALHFNGPRKQRNFVPINCGAIPENLLESELFGYMKGAFTGAERDRSGMFEEANGGTLFLDEMGEMPLALQVKLLRVLQDGEVRRIGSTQPRRVDVRIIAATNRDLTEEVRAGRFREDLYYRINVVTVGLPPLRDRGRDGLLLAERHLERLRKREKRPGLTLGSEARRAVLSHPWRGNVRELLNAIERAVAMSDSDVIEPGDLFQRSSRDVLLPPNRGGTLKESLLRVEEVAVLDALKEAGGVVAQAARLLGVSRQHLHTRIRKLGLRERM